MRHLLRTPTFVLVWTIGFFEEMGFMLLVNVPGRLLELGIGEAGIGLAFSAAAAVAIAGRPMFGRILDVVHRRSVLRAAGLVEVVAVFSLALIDAAGVALWTAFVVQRVSQILLFTALLTYAADVLPAELRTSGLAVFGLSGLFPIAISNLVGDAVIDRAGYQGAIGVAGAACAVSWALTWRLPLLPVLGRRPRRSFWAALRQPDLRPLWLITLMFAAGVETLFTFMRPYVDTLGPGSLGRFFAVYGVAAIGLRLAGGSRYDALPQRAVTATAVVGQGAALVILATATGSVGFLAAAALGGASHGLVFPIINAAVVTRARTSERGSAMATFTSIFDVSVLALVPVAGLLIDLLDYRAGFGAIGGFVAAGALTYAWWDRRRVAAVGV